MQQKLITFLALLSFLFSSACLAANSPEKAGSTKGSSEGKNSESDKEESSLRMLLFLLAESLNSKDAEKLSSFWTDDAAFIDESGEETKGRAALKDRFKSMFAQRDKANFQLHPESIFRPAANVALVRGIVSRQSDGGLNLPTSRFTMVLLKQDSTWMIKESTETKLTANRPADQLNQLAWLLGKWRVDKANSSINLDVEWGSGHNFIISKCIQDKGDGIRQTDTQIIGWDPRSNSIVSWHFDCNGGFGYGKWRKEADTWLLDFAGVAPDGSSTQATNIFSKKNSDEFSWQSTQQKVDDSALGDTEAIIVRRVRP